MIYTARCHFELALDVVSRAISRVRRDRRDRGRYDRRRHSTAMLSAMICAFLARLGGGDSCQRRPGATNPSNSVPCGARPLTAPIPDFAPSSRYSTQRPSTEPFSFEAWRCSCGLSSRCLARTPMESLSPGVPELETKNGCMAVRTPCRATAVDRCALAETSSAFNLS